MLRSRKVRAVFWWVVSLVLFAGAVLYVFQPFAVRRVDRVADSFLRAVFERDGKAFYEFLHPVDKAELELTPEQCQRLLDEVILPKFRGCKVVAWAGPHSGGSGLGYSWVVLECDGKRKTFGINAGDVSGIGGTVGINLLLKFVWDWEYERRYGRWSSGYLESCLEGVKRDRAKLEEIGIKGWATWKGYALPWGEWLVDAERRFAEQKRLSTPGADLEEVKR